MTQKGIVSTAFYVSLIVIMAKLIGFAREATIAAIFGANDSTDAYFFALNMPAMIFPAVCASMSTAFLSIYVGRSVKEGNKSGDSFASNTFVGTLIIALILSVIGFFALPVLVPLFAPGFSHSTVELAIILSRIIMGSFVLIMTQYMLTAILNSKKFFYGAQICGIAQNVFVICITLLFGRSQTVYFLTWTVLIGLTIQVLMLGKMAIKRVTFGMHKERFKFDLKTLIWLSLPIMLGNSVVQISNIVEKFLASNLHEGAVSALSYSSSLNSIVISVFVVSLSTVIYPTLTENVSKNSLDLYGKNLTHNMILLYLTVLPISAITFLYAQDIVSIVYERGNFDSEATKLTALALKYSALGYPFIALREILIRAYYAINDTKTPMINGAITVSMSIVLSVILVRIMGIGGITLASSAAALVTAGLLLLNIRTKTKHIHIKPVTISLLKITIAGLVSLLLLTQVPINNTGWYPAIKFLVGTCIEVGIYIVMLFVFNVKEFKDIIGNFFNK